MAIDKDNAVPRRAGGARASRPAGAKRQGTTDEHDVGSALRTAYQRTVEESIPPEMLDLLGKLS